MRKVTFGGACSLDNFIARSDDAVDWLMWCDEAGKVMKEYWAKIDTIVMGRKTYEVAIGGESPDKGTRGPYGNIKTYVFSRTLKPEKTGEVEIISEDPGEFVKNLKQQDGKEICVMGGGELGRSLLEAGVIDEIGLNVHPVLLGSGIPLFHGMERQIDLELVTCMAFTNGCVFVTYRVNH